jgi:H/ACA ribonucleoprotein complex non-core subunit NAF1
VMKPMYIVRFPSASDLEANDRIAVGAKVFYAPDRSTFLFTNALRQMKGSDASNVYDEEVDDREMEFSDDEEERAHKKMLEKLSVFISTHLYCSLIARLIPKCLIRRKERAVTSGTPSSSNFYPQRKSHASTSALPSDDIADIFYGDAYDDPPAAAAGPSSSSPSSSATIALTSALDPRAARRAMASAYDEVSPYDDPPLGTLPVFGDDAEMAESHPVERSTASRMPSGGRGVPGSGIRGRGRGRGRGDNSAPSRGRGRGRGRDRGVNGDRHAGASWNTSNMIGLLQPYSSASATTAQAAGEYDPRHPEFDDSLRQERELSSTSATIASVTGEWGSSAIDPSTSMGMNMTMLGSQHPFANGFYNPPFPAPGMNIGMGAGENFVAPHINPRFAAAMGGMDGAMNYHLLAQQQQLFYQHQQQMQMQIHMQQQNVFGGDTISATWGSVTAASYEDDNVPHKSDDLGLMDSTSHHPVDE